MRRLRLVGLPEEMPDTIDMVAARPEMLDFQLLARW